MERKRCKVCGDIINVGEGSAFDGVHVKCARAYISSEGDDVVPSMVEKAPKKKVYQRGISRPVSNTKVDQEEIVESTFAATKSKSIKVDAKISGELYELLLKKIEQGNVTISAYIRSLIEKDLEDTL